MIKRVKVDNLHHFWSDKISGELVNKFDYDNKNLIFNFTSEDGTIIQIDNPDIHQQYGDIIYFMIGDDKYIIEDVYQDVLTRAGYLVMNNYDKIKTKDKDEGINIRTNFINLVNKSLDKFTEQYNFEVNKYQTPTLITFEYEDKGIKNTILINTVNNIVNKNQQRKINQLSFYPFVKDMDKYGTLYLSIFQKQIDEDVADGTNLEVSMSFISTLISNINNLDYENEYHFHSLPINKRIINCQGL